MGKPQLLYKTVVGDLTYRVVKNCGVQVYRTAMLEAGSYTRQVFTGSVEGARQYYLKNIKPLENKEAA